MSNVMQRIKSVLVDVLGSVPAHIHEETTMEYLGLDSLDTVEITMALEEEFQIEILDIEMEDIITLSDMVDMVERALKTS